MTKKLGSHNMTMLYIYLNPCYSIVCYKRTSLFYKCFSLEIRKLFTYIQSHRSRSTKLLSIRILIFSYPCSFNIFFGCSKEPVLLSTRKISFG